MIKTVFVFFLASLAIQAKPSVGGIFDEAKAELENLRELIVGSIASADIAIRDLNNSLIVNGDTVMKDGELAIQTANEKIIEELSTLEELAHTAEVNATTCLSRGNFLKELPLELVRQMVLCVAGHIREAIRILQSSKYVIDNTINRVDELEYKLNLCKEDNILCISPIVRQIGVELVQLPETIKTEELRAKQLIDTLQVSIQDCSDNKVSQFVSDANAILADITQCINKLIG